MDDQITNSRNRLRQHSPRSASIYFIQECQACGRKMRVRLEFLGRQIVCQHCGRHLIAADSAAVGSRRPHFASAVDRADQLLAQYAGPQFAGQWDGE